MSGGRIAVTRSSGLAVPQAVLPSVGVSSVAALRTFATQFLSRQVFVGSTDNIRAPLPSRLYSTIERATVLLTRNGDMVVDTARRSLAARRTTTVLNVSQRALVELLSGKLVPFSHPSGRHHVQLRSLLRCGQTSGRAGSYTLDRVVNIKRSTRLCSLPRPAPRRTVRTMSRMEEMQTSTIDIS